MTAEPADTYPVIEADNLRERLELLQSAAEHGHEQLVSPWTLPEDLALDEYNFKTVTGDVVIGADHHDGALLTLVMENDAALVAYLWNHAGAIVKRLELQERELKELRARLAEHGLSRGGQKSMSDTLKTYDEVPGLELHYLSGQAPVQAEGLIGELPFYFRARSQSYSFSVASYKDGDPLDAYLGDDKDGYHVRHDYGESPYAASWMEHDEAEKLIVACAKAYLEENKHD